MAGDGAVAETLTPGLLRALFDVEACVVRTPGGTFVDYLPLGTPLPPMRDARAGCVSVPNQQGKPMPMIRPYPICAALLVANAIAHAGASDAGSDALEIVTVTATKLNLTQAQLPQAGNVVTNSQILAQAQTTITDVLRQLPGIQFQVAGAPGSSSIRGCARFTGSTLYVFDGITMNAGGSGDIGYLLGQLDPTMVRSVEVLRGPRATTWRQHHRGRHLLLHPGGHATRGRCRRRRRIARLLEGARGRRRQTVDG